MLHAVLRAATEGEEAAPSPLLPAGYDILWSSVCFVIILVFFWRYVLPRVQKLLDERAEAIEGNIAKADEAQRKAEAALEEYTAQLADARTEAGRIRETAREDGKKIVAEAKDAGHGRGRSRHRVGAGADRGRAPVGARLAPLRGGHARHRPRVGRHRREPLRRPQGDRGRRPLPRRPGGLERPPPEGRSSPWVALRGRPWPGRDATLTALGRADLRVAEDLLAAGRVVGSSKHLRSALTDSEADAAQKRALVEARLRLEAHRRRRDAAHRPRLEALVGLVRPARGHRGARPARRVRVGAATSPIDAELFAFERAVASDAELELALGSKLSPAASKVQIVDRLLAGNASPQTVAIVRHLVQQPRGRRIGELLRHAAGVVADAARVRHRHGHHRDAAVDRPARAPRAGSRGAVRPRASGSTPSSIPPCSAGSACRSATTSSTAASPHASARCGRSLPADAG